jgi:hypothetical protein
MTTEGTKVIVEMVQKLIPERSEQEWADMRAEFIAGACRHFVGASLPTSERVGGEGLEPPTSSV